MTLADRFKIFYAAYAAKYGNRGPLKFESSRLVEGDFDFRKRWMLARFGPESRITELWFDWQDWISK